MILDLREKEIINLNFYKIYFKKNPQHEDFFFDYIIILSISIRNNLVIYSNYHFHTNHLQDYLTNLHWVALGMHKP